jgi:hypothetical protein
MVKLNDIMDEVCREHLMMQILILHLDLSRRIPWPDISFFLQDDDGDRTTMRPEQEVLSIER